MANIKSAIKRNRQNLRRREHNRIFRGRARTLLKKAQTVIQAGEVEEARAATKMAVSALDKAADKGVLHKNNAARRKAKIMQSFASLEKSQR